ncbi:hypothetical protein BDR26DRAFT_892494 [Obelidium mucronatum]|nr:hypothetical protein BDR26DRAFT_892494 [Obelidium mucronatum]
MKQFYRHIAAILAILFLTQHAIVAATAWDENAIAQQEFAESKQPGSSWFQPKSPNSDDFLSRLKKRVLTPRIILGQHVRTSMLANGIPQWGLCDTGAQMTIVDRVWAAANGIKRLARVAMTAIGFNNIPRQVMMDISEPMELANPSGELTLMIKSNEIY